MFSVSDNVFVCRVNWYVSSGSCLCFGLSPILLQAVIFPLFCKFDQVRRPLIVLQLHSKIITISKYFYGVSNRRVRGRWCPNVMAVISDCVSPQTKGHGGFWHCPK
jgi:hypothetical protein